MNRRGLRMPYNAAERKDIRKAEKQEKLKEQQRHEIMATLMSLAPGRAWICDILEACHIFASSYTQSASAMAFAEGERNVGLRLLNDIMSSCPDQYVQMMKERNTDATRVADAEPD